MKKVNYNCRFLARLGQYKDKLLEKITIIDTVQKPTIKEGHRLRKYIFLGCGGFAGAILRYSIEQIRIQNYHENIPLNTLFINVSGTFLMAFILTIAFEVWEIHADIRLGITTGFLGAYTTFSTLCKEAVSLMRNGDYFSAISYITVSVMLGLGASYFGIVLARKIGSLKENKKLKLDTPSPVEVESLIKNESDVIK